MTKVLFVCLGNICRSPSAEGVFLHLADQEGLDVEVDSASTSGWHQGEPPDQRAQAVLRDMGIDISGQASRKLRRSDFYDYDFVLGMDAQNLADIQAVAPDDATAHIGKFLDFAPDQPQRDVPDPYYDGSFDRMLTLLQQAAGGLIRTLK